MNGKQARPENNAEYDFAMDEKEGLAAKIAECERALAGAVTAKK